jgi:uncharacterized protein YndB with AHSA1/START domain
MSETSNPVEATDYEQRLPVSTPPERVFEALTTPAGVSGWWMPTTGSGREGGELRLSFPPGPGVMHVDTAEPSSLVVWTVLACDFLPDWVGTRIHFALRSDGRDGTVLDFRHEGLTPQLECFDQCRQGWNYYLPSLRDYLEVRAGRPGNRHRVAAG